MKRERKNYKCDGNEVSISRVWPIFFWEFCVVCQKEFRREYGWQHFTNSFKGITRYICCECCPTEQEAVDAMDKYVKDWKEKMKRLRPKPPPAPPKPQCNHLPNNMGFELFCDKCGKHFNKPEE